MNPAIILVVALIVIYAGATGRAEAVWLALTDPTKAGVTSTKTKTGTGVSSGGSNPSTKAPTRLTPDAK